MKMMNDLEIDIQEVIDLIRERPVIWDRTCDVYKDKAATKAAWKEIYGLVKPDFDELDESKQLEIGNFITNRWTNMRDNWMKSHKKLLTQMVSGMKPGKKYIYYDKLNFLTKVAAGTNYDTLKTQYKLRNNEKDSSPVAPSDDSSSYRDSGVGIGIGCGPMKYEDTDDEDDMQDSPQDCSMHSLENNSMPPIPTAAARLFMKSSDNNSSSSSSSRPKKRKCSSTDLCTTNFVQVVETPPPTVDHGNAVNYDQSFFDSLIPFILQFDEDQKLEFRTEVLNLVRKIKKQKRND